MFQNLELKEFEIDLGERNIGIINRDVCGVILSLHPHRAILTIYLAKAAVQLAQSGYKLIIFTCRVHNTKTQKK